MTSNTSPLPLQSILFHGTAQNLFTKTPYDWQVKVGSSILSHVENGVPIKTLCVRPTGGGKTLLFTTTAAALKGITLCIVPLLSLGADQAKKLIDSTQNAARFITGFHLDELPISEHANLITQVKDYATRNKTVILFTSPQALLRTNSPILPYLLSDEAPLSMIVMDEIHLACHFGKSFRKEFSELKSHLFQKIHTSIPLLFLTATCTDRIKSSFESLIGVEINSVHWPSSSKMQNRTVKLNVKYTTLPISSIVKTLKSHVSSPPPFPNKVIIYSNQRTKITTCSEKIESFFDRDDDLWEHDVLTLVGTLTKDEKGFLVNTFLDDNSTKASVLCATSGVGNAGLDSQNIKAVYRIDFPPSILDIAQERGRAGRRHNASPDVYSYNVCFSLESFLYVFKRINDPDSDVIDDEYRKEQESDLFEVAKLLASQSKCYYICFEEFLGNPKTCNSMTSPCRDCRICEPNDTPCGYCPTCTGTAIFPILNKEGVKLVLFHIFVDSDTSIKGERKWKTVLEAMKNVPDVNKLMFDSKAKTVVRGKLMKALFVLIAFGIIKMKLEDGEIIFGAAKCTESPTELAFNKDEYWTPIMHY